MLARLPNRPGTIVRAITEVDGFRLQSGMAARYLALLTEVSRSSWLGHAGLREAVTDGTPRLRATATIRPRSRTHVGPEDDHGKRSRTEVMVTARKKRDPATFSHKFAESSNFRRCPSVAPGSEGKPWSLAIAP